MSFSTVWLYISQFLTRNRAAFFMVQWLNVLPHLAILEHISAFTESHATPFLNLIVSTWDPHSIKHHLVGVHLKQPVTHVAARFTDRKTLVYDPVRCGSVPAAYSQYPAALLLFLTTAQTNWSLWDFLKLFCTYCDLKLSWLFSKIAKQFAILMQAIFAI